MAADPLHGTDPESFVVVADSGELALKLSVGLMLFFPNDLKKHGPGVLQLWNELLGWVGREAFTWARLGGGNKSRKMNAAAYQTIEAWLSGTKSAGDVCWIQAHGGDYEAIGEHGFALDGYGPGEEEQLSGLKVTLPLSVLELEGDALADRLCRLAGHLQFVCGTAGLMLHASPFGRTDLWGEMKRRVVRYEGVEPDMLEDGEYMAAKGLTGVNWLTFVGARALKALGGKAGLQTQLTDKPNVTLRDLGGGVALQAGPRPVLGDRNRAGDELSAYRDVYQLLKKLIVADADLPFDEEEFDGDATVAWVKRFERG